MKMVGNKLKTPLIHQLWERFGKEFLILRVELAEGLQDIHHTKPLARS